MSVEWEKNKKITSSECLVNSLYLAVKVHQIIDTSK